MTASETAAVRVTLDGPQIVRTIAAAHRDLLAAQAAHDALAVDCSAVSEVDVTLIQLLLAARASAQLAGKSLVLTAPASGLLREALAQGGFLPEETGAAGPKADFWLCRARA